MESPEPQCGKFTRKLLRAAKRTNDLIHSMNKHIPSNNAKNETAQGARKNTHVNWKLTLIKVEKIVKIIMA